MYDGDLIAADAAWVHYTTRLELSSVGVLGVTVNECAAERLPARPDPQPFPEHAVIDFGGLSDNRCERKGKKLKAKAEARGWLYRAPQIP